jgi:hypothetical protein
MSELKTGEFINSEGERRRAYSLVLNTGKAIGISVEARSMGDKLPLSHPDAIPALEAALAAAHEEVNWVPLGNRGVEGKGLRVSRDGLDQQVEWPDGTWHTACDYYGEVEGYRAALRAHGLLP